MAINKSRAEYLVFTDGDCVPRRDFLAAHWHARNPRRFLSGGAVRLPIGVSKALSDEAIRSGEAFRRSYLSSLVPGERISSKKLIGYDCVTTLLNNLTTARPTWNGGNASTYKAHIMAVNGMDERMVYGGQDRELGERLERIGIRGKQLRYKAITLHLDHPRGYKSEEGIRFNKKLREENEKKRVRWTAYGIQKKSSAPPDLTEASRQLQERSKK